MRKIYLDVSDTVHMRLNTGIQRVVRRIVTEGIVVGHEFGVEFVPVIPLGGSIVTLNADGQKALHTPRKETPGYVHPQLVEGYSGIKSFLKKFPGPYGFVRRKMSERRNFKGLTGPAICSFAPGDCLVLLDAFWNPNSALLIARKMIRRRKIPCIGVIYDMIPVSNPEMFDTELPNMFATRLAALVKLGVKFVAISKDAASKALAFATHHGYRGAIKDFYLGYDVAPAKASQANGEWPDALWSGGGPVHLMVGTVEPRKGVDLAFAAMKELWADGGSDTLLIIGRAGWLADDLLDRLRSHPLFDRRLFLVQGANDVMLAEAYRRADDCLVASRAEGFGLPLIEALSCALPVIASDIDVFREIGRDTPLFFRPGDGHDLARAIRQMNAERDARREAAAQFVWIDWRDSARQFIRSVLDQADHFFVPATAADAARPDHAASAG